MKALLLAAVGLFFGWPQRRAGEPTDGRPGMRMPKSFAWRFPVVKASARNAEKPTSSGFGLNRQKIVVLADAQA